MESIGVVIPTYNGKQTIYNLLTELIRQRASIHRILVIDSGSTDQTLSIVKQFDVEWEVIPQSEFGHGKTRQDALEKMDTDIVVYMTQDAIPADGNAVGNLVQFLLEHDNMAAVCGRQLPSEDTGPLGAYARLYNYGVTSCINTKKDIPVKAIRTAFMSDSFSAYRRKQLLQIGGFPTEVNFGEDMYVAAKLILAGYATGYCAEAQVYHAHDLSLVDEIKRNYQMSKFHQANPWLLQNFGKAEKTGAAFVKAELHYFAGRGEWINVTKSLMQDGAKMMGYLGGKFI